jgi:hypothetical protein
MSALHFDELSASLDQRLGWPLSKTSRQASPIRGKPLRSIPSRHYAAKVLDERFGRFISELVRKIAADREGFALQPAVAARSVDAD